MTMGTQDHSSVKWETAPKVVFTRGNVSVEEQLVEILACLDKLLCTFGLVLAECAFEAI